MVIRFFRELDYPPVSELLNLVYHNPTRMSRMTPERLRTEFNDRGTNPHESCVVLEAADGELVGFCGYDPMPGGRALLDGPVLKADYRGQGWGQRLWEEVSGLLRARGIRTIGAVLGEDNAHAEGFLKHLGFEDEKTDLIVTCERRERHPVSVPDGVVIERAGPDLDLAEYEDHHARMFARRSLGYLGVLARSGHYHIFTAREGRSLVGHLELEFLDDVATIEAYGVAPESRRRGLGRALLATALNHAWSEPSIRMVRQIWRTTEPGFLQVYLELGFVQKYAIRGLVRRV